MRISLLTPFLRTPHTSASPTRTHSTHKFFVSTNPHSMMSHNCVLVYISMMFWHWVFFWQFPIYGIFYIIYLQGYGWVVGTVALWYIAHVFLDNSPITGGGLWLKFNKSWIVNYPLHYFPTHYIKTCDLSWKKQYIFGLHPHGLMPWLALPVGRTTEWNALFPGILIRTLCAGVLLRIPICREALLWNGSVDAARFNAEKVLQSGSSLSVFPGGSEEMIMSECGKETVVITKRKGFVRLAFENGCDLVPVYAFGVSDLYGSLKIARNFRLWVLKKTQIGFNFGWGRTFFNLLPAQIPLYIVVGKPIPVPKNPNPTEKEIDAVHATYMQELEQLFEKHKEECGYGDRTLTVI